MGAFRPGVGFLAFLQKRDILAMALLPFQSILAMVISPFKDED
jgi:hypothetical protein